MPVSLKNIGDVILGHTFRGAITAQETGSFFVVQAKNVRSNGVVEDETLVQTDLEGTKINAFVKEGDVLLSNRGTFRAGVFYGNQSKVVAASSLYIIRIAHNEKCLPEYLTIFLNSQAGQTLLEGINRGTLIKSLPKKSLMDLPVPLPALAVQKTVIDVQNNYATRVELYERKSRLEAEIAHQTIASLISQ